MRIDDEQFDPGALIHLVTIQQAAMSRSDDGEAIQNWDTPTPVATCRAAIYQRTSREVYRARQIIAETDLVLRIRGRFACEERMRVAAADGRVFDILGVQSDDGRAPQHATWLFLFCREGVSKGS